MKTIFDKTNYKNKTLKNRIFRSATWMHMSKNGEVNDDIINLYENYAKGEIASIITGVTSVCPQDEKIDGMMSIADDSYIKYHEKLTTTVHKYDSLIFLQIAIVDIHTRGLETINNLNQEDIDKIIEQFTNAAIRAEKANYDGVQIHAAHFLFLSKFISPLYNTREDKYGNDNAGRGRILVEILNSIKANVNENFIVSIKINSSDFIDGALVEKDFLEISKNLDAEGIDLIEVSGNSPSRPTIQNPSHEAYFMQSAIKLKNIVKCPVILTGGHRSIENMEKILNETDIEYLGISRPFIYEPHLLRRWAKGNREPSKCISCNFCYKTLNHECVYKI